jgi:putative acetyltransferase
MTESSSCSSAFTIRVATAEDLAALEDLYPQAFPDEDLLPLIRDLVNLGPPKVLSLVAVDTAATRQILGHVMFTLCTVADDNSTVISLLGPLAVHPTRQKQGIGSALVKNGMQRVTNNEMNVSVVLVLGSPQYYGRFGFRRENDVSPPYPLPEKWSSAWQSLYLANEESRPNSPQKRVAGKLVVPPAWQAKELWS